jgi:hypothetical protein
MAGAQDPVAEGIAGAREMLALARQWFAGACLMPPSTITRCLRTSFRSEHALA